MVGLVVCIMYVLPFWRNKYIYNCLFGSWTSELQCFNTCKYLYSYWQWFPGCELTGVQGVEPPATDDNPLACSCNFCPQEGWHSRPCQARWNVFVSGGGCRFVRTLYNLVVKVVCLKFWHKPHLWLGDTGGTSPELGGYNVTPHSSDAIAPCCQIERLLQLFSQKDVAVLCCLEYRKIVERCWWELTALPNPLAGGQWASCPFSKILTPAIGPSGLRQQNS